MDADPAAADHRSRINAARLSVLVGLVMLALKLSAFLITHSAAIFADALESVVHVGATVTMYWCLRISQRPPDVDHPYGHGRAGYLSIGFEGGMVALAALAVFWQAGANLFFAQHEVHRPVIGLWLTGAAAMINLLLGCHLVRIGRRTRSAILVADGKHVLSDVYTSVGALIGVALVWWTGDVRIDSIAAIILACLVLVTAFLLIREAVEGLMDKVDAAALARVVDAINLERDPEWLDVHNLRLRLSGDDTYVDLHLVVPPDWSVKDAHHAVDTLEKRILATLGRKGAVMVHLDYPKDAHPSPAPHPRPFTVAIATRVGPMH